MKRKPSPAKASDRPKPSQSDNLCKRLAEEYPAEFAQWLFGAGGQVKVEKTELSREPIRADSVIFSRGANEKLHTEFQTTLKSEVPVPLRMLDYLCRPQAAESEPARAPGFGRAQGDG